MILMRVGFFLLALVALSLALVVVSGAIKLIGQGEDLGAFVLGSVGVLAVVAAGALFFFAARRW